MVVKLPVTSIPIGGEPAGFIILTLKESLLLLFKFVSNVKLPLISKSSFKKYGESSIPHVTSPKRLSETRVPQFNNSKSTSSESKLVIAVLA